jgi:Trypsin-like peptidase domain
VTVPLTNAAARSQWRLAKRDGTPAPNTDAIFAVFRGSADGKTLTVLGTGFYIGFDGLFVTAQHCFRDREGKIATDQPHGIIHLLPDNQFVLRPILRSWNSAVADVSVGVAGPIINNKTGERVRNAVMVLSAERPPAGTEVATYAFANTEMWQDEGKTSINLRPDMYAGRLIDYFPRRRDAAMLHWPVYETSMPIHAGASGGPVVSERGTVFAVNTSGVEGATDISYVTPIDFILDAVIEGVSLGEGEPARAVTLRELAELGLVVFDPPFPKRI